MKAVKAITLLAFICGASLSIYLVVGKPDYFIEHEISLGPTKASYEIVAEGEVALDCAMGPYVGVSGNFREASKLDLENNILVFGEYSCRGEYLMKKNRAKIVNINPGEYYRTVSAEFVCATKQTRELDFDPVELCRSILNFDDPIFEE